MATEKIFNQNGGVIDGTLTVYKTVIDFSDGGSTGDYSTRIVVPAGAIVTGGFISNKEDDLASGGSATLRLKVGSTSFGAAAAGKADVKGTIVYQAPLEDIGTNDHVPAPVVTTEDTHVTLTICTAALTAGTIEVCVIALVV